MLLFSFLRITPEFWGGWRQPDVPAPKGRQERFVMCYSNFTHELLALVCQIQLLYIWFLKHQLPLKQADYFHFPI